MAEQKFKAPPKAPPKASTRVRIDPTGPRRRIAGSDLVPSVDANRAVTLREHRYWIGTLPDCPREHVDIAGVNFPKVNELLVPDRTNPTKKTRIPVFGSIVHLSVGKLEQIRERLTRTVVRFTEAEVREEAGTGQNVGDPHQRPRRGHLITIPRAEDIEVARKEGRAIHLYVASADDVPVARFLFMQLCADQKNGMHGSVYPDPLEVTGLEIPGDGSPVVDVPSDALETAPTI